MAERTGRIQSVQVKILASDNTGPYGALVIGTETVYMSASQVGLLGAIFGNIREALGKTVAYDTDNTLLESGSQTFGNVVRYLTVS